MPIITQLLTAGDSYQFQSERALPYKRSNIHCRALFLVSWQQFVLTIVLRVHHASHLSKYIRLTSSLGNLLRGRKKNRIALWIYTYCQRKGSLFAYVRRQRKVHKSKTNGRPKKFHWILRSGNGSLDEGIQAAQSLPRSSLPTGSLSRPDRASCSPSARITHRRCPGRT